MNYLLTNEESKRLRFRLLTPEDYDAWLPLFSTKNVALHLGLDTSLTQKQLCTKWFDKAFHRYDNNLGGMNVLVDKITNIMVGQCGLLTQTIQGQAGPEERLEIGYSLLPKYWHNGYALEAASKCKHFAFKNDFAPSLVSCVHVNNIASERVALKNGMTFEKKSDGYNVFSIAKEDWKQY